MFLMMGDIKLRKNMKKWLSRLRRDAHAKCTNEKCSVKVIEERWIEKRVESSPTGQSWRALTFYCPIMPRNRSAWIWFNALAINGTSSITITSRIILRSNGTFRFVIFGLSRSTLRNSRLKFWDAKLEEQLLENVTMFRENIFAKEDLRFLSQDPFYLTAIRQTSLLFSCIGKSEIHRHEISLQVFQTGKERYEWRHTREIMYKRVYYYTFN